MESHHWQGHTFDVRLIVWGRWGMCVALSVDGKALPLQTWESPGLLVEARQLGSLVPGPSTPFTLTDEGTEVSGRLDFDVAMGANRYPYRIVVADSLVASGELRQQIQWRALGAAVFAFVAPFALLVYLAYRE